MPGLKNETFGSGDQTWLGSTHGIANARTGVINLSAFDAETHYPQGYLPSGTALAVVDGEYVPYDGDAESTDGAGVLAGFLLFERKVTGDAKFGADVIDHGRAIVSKLAAIQSGFEAPVAAKNATTFVFV